MAAVKVVGTGKIPLTVAWSRVPLSAGIFVQELQPTIARSRLFAERAPVRGQAILSGRLVLLIICK